jgi:ABC-type bacteriocin/lantibiotic exporter with double-glycine peptidase domain
VSFLSLVPPKVLRGLIKQASPVLFGGLALNLLGLALPLFSMLVYDKVVGNEVHETLWALALGMLLVMALEFVLRLSRAYILEFAAANWDRTLDRRVTTGVLAHPLDRTLSVGALFANLRELSARRDVLSGASLLPLMDMPFLMVFVLVLWLVAGPLVLVPLVLGLLVVGIQFLLHIGVEVFSRRSIKYQKDKIDAWHELVVTRTALAGSARAELAVRGLSTKSALASRASARYQFWAQMLSSVAPAVASLTSVLVLVWGVYLVEAQQMSTGQLVAASILASRLVGAFMSIQPIWMRFKELREALKELGRIVELDADPVAGLERARVVKPVPVLVENLKYSYPDAELPTLSGINFTLQAGELAVVVGKVGCGKSTLLRMLAGHFAPSEGVFALGGLGVKSAAQARHLAQEVAYLDQNPVLFTGTVEDYLFAEHGHGEAYEHALVRFDSLGLAEVLTSCSLGMTTVIGFGGSTLSGGQRRILSFARSVILGRSVLVLDEPSAGLDLEAERAVVAVLRKLKGQATMVVASHAADVVALADKVLVLDKGHQIGWGSPRGAVERLA